MKQDLRHKEIGSRYRAVARYSMICNRLQAKTVRNRQYVGREMELDRETFIKWFMENDFEGCSVDRIDNSKGYTHDNIQLIPLSENMRKDRVKAADGMCVCYSCNKNKDLGQFAVDKRRVTGRSTLCKTCDAVRSRKRYRRTVMENKNLFGITFKINKEGEWTNLTTDEMFKGKRVVIFGLPGAFTPTCSKSHLPTFEREYDNICELGIDEIYCISVNDTFVMNAWAEKLGVEKVKMVPDGNIDFTSAMDMDVPKTDLGFGWRSWRYSAIINDGQIEILWEEDHDSEEADPYRVSKAEVVIDYLKSEKQA